MSEPFNRTVNSTIVAAMPAQFDILTGSETAHEGQWVAIKVYNALFADNDTDIVLGSGTAAEGKNMYALNGNLPQGEKINGNFTKITIAEASTMVILAYRW